MYGLSSIVGWKGRWYCKGSTRYMPICLLVWAQWSALLGCKGKNLRHCCEQMHGWG